jgi:uncharacterized membrane protein
MKGMRGVYSFILVLFIFTFSILGMQLSTPLAYGAEEKKDLPPRAIAMAPEYTGVILPAGDDLSLDIEVYNRGRADEDIDVSLTTVPKGWKASIKTYSFEVSGVHVLSDNSKSLTLKAEPDKDMEPGKYVFEIKAETADGAFTTTRKVTVTVKEKGEVIKSEDLGPSRKRVRSSNLKTWH